MQFSTNSPILFLLVGAIIAAVLAQSVFFLVKALRRARVLGMDMETTSASGWRQPNARWNFSCGS